MRFEKDVLLAGKFRLERELSHGGMGSIWVAQHVQLGTLVAVKFMRPAFSDLPVLRARFEREARAAAQLKSPHIVQVHDFGFEEDEVPYLVMELLQGEDLSKRLQRCGRLSLQETLHIIVQAGKALRSVHEAGFVHRDLKPANFFLARVDGEDGEIVKLLDFGIAKDVSAVLAADISATGEVIGSPNYMSPEQFYGERDVDARSDLWSLGVILFKMLTGHLPFPGDAIGRVVTKVILGTVPSARELAPDLPSGIDAFFTRALARDRDERFQNVREMVNELARVAGAPPFFSFGGDTSLGTGWAWRGSGGEPGLADPGTPPVAQLTTMPLQRRSDPNDVRASTPNPQSLPGTLTGAINLSAPHTARAAIARVAGRVAIGATIAVVGVGLFVATLKGASTDGDPTTTQASAAASAPALAAPSSGAPAGLAAVAAIASAPEAPTAATPAVLPAPLPLDPGAGAPNAASLAPAQASPVASGAAARRAAPARSTSPTTARTASTPAPRKTLPGPRKKSGGSRPDWGL
ncbi:protein kinase domain-containing protein [Sorangium sp. So ce1000]|uniref:serine/threonine-protein kinase n=1 Tax=Sorangium sp. So ce1000 TaxID=3133325 RepID=UPI003F6123C6